MIDKKDKSFLEIMIPIWYSALAWLSIGLISTSVFVPMLREVPALIQQFQSQQLKKV
jgi:uncharacterized membrane protein YagU involved in acid resistance